METDETARKLNFHSERLNTLEKTMANMERIAMSVERVNERISAVEKVSEKNHKFLVGNGEPGFDERIRQMERDIASIKKSFLWVGGIAGGWLVLKVVEIIASHL